MRVKRRFRWTAWSPTERKAALILAGIAAGEAVWVYFTVAGRPRRFASYIGLFAPGAPGVAGWTSALAVAAVFLLYCARIPAVRETLFQVSRLKMLGLLVACGAALCEETVFRKFLMDALQSRGHSLILQVAASAFAFGLLHGIWGLMSRRLTIFLGAMTATSLLGALLAGVYVVSHRWLLPCIVAHFLVDAFAEPGLVLAGLRGDMGRRRQSRAAGSVSDAASDTPQIIPVAS